MTAVDRLLPRAAIIAAVAAVVLALFVLAPLFSQKLDWFGLPDEVVHTVGHLVVYGAIAAGLAIGLGGRWLLAWPLSLAIAAAEELHQAFVPGRCVDIKDFLLNAAAITVVVIIVAVLSHQAAWRAAQPAVR